MTNRFMYLRDDKLNPCGCLVIDVDRKGHTLSYQMSVLNPADRFKFERKLAREIALKRLDTKPITLSLNSSEVTRHDISRLVMKDILNTKKVPTRARKAAQRWLMVADYIAAQQNVFSKITAGLTAADDDTTV